MLRPQRDSLLLVGLLSDYSRSLIVGGGPHKPVISGTMPNGTAGVLYSGTLTVTGGVAPFNGVDWIGVLCFWIQSPFRGTWEGLFGTVWIKDARRPSPSRSIDASAISGTLPNGNVDVPYSGTLTVTGGRVPFTWNITGLPATLTFASSGNTVTISGNASSCGDDLL